LLVLAPTSEAARDVLRKQGFENAETVAMLLASETLQEQARGAVLWIDEAGLLSTRSMDKFLALAGNLGARVVLVGDTRQHHAVERGQAFQLLQNSGEMAVATVNEIVRQNGTYRKIVELAESRQTDKLFDLMSEANVIVESTIEERQKQLARDYVSVIGRGESAWVVAPTHAECRNVTEGIREALKERGVLKAGKKCEVLRNLSWTEAEKRDPDHYENGLVVQINRHVKGFSLGERMEVVSTDEETVLVRGGKGIRELPLSRPECFGVYKRESIELCEGDRIRITANSRTADDHRVNNGNLFKVKRVSRDGNIILDNGWRLEKGFGHLTHGYAMTSMTSQGKDVDWIFIAQSPELSYAASDANQVYVSISRGRKGMKLYTTSIETLREMASRVRERPMATEILRGRAEEMRQAEVFNEDTEMNISQKPGQFSAREFVMEAGAAMERILREKAMVMGM
jgi:ATP-dependent exoDNAse (exonuclease V) alpha subunit